MFTKDGSFIRNVRGMYLLKDFILHLVYQYSNASYGFLFLSSFIVKTNQNQRAAYRTQA